MRKVLKEDGMMKRGIIIVSIIFIFISFTSSVQITDFSYLEQKIISEISQERAFQHIQELVKFSPRLAGSGRVDDDAIGGVYDAALYIKTQLESYDLDTKIETFSLEVWRIYDYHLIIDFDGDDKTFDDRLDLTENSIPFVPGPTWEIDELDIDIKRNIVIVDDWNKINKIDYKNKIVISSAYMQWRDKWKLSNIIWDKGTEARIVFSENTNYVISKNWWRTFSISYTDYNKILRNYTKDSKVILKYRGEKKNLKGYNVVGKIEGDDDREIILTAHFDSVWTDGAIDNASGVATLLEVARILSEYKFQHDIYFVFVDAEEIGGYGSEEFVVEHYSEIKDAIAAINVDCVASGTPDGLTVGFNHRYPKLMKSWGKFWENQKTDPELDRLISDIGKEIVGYTPNSIYVEDMGGGSDFANFTMKGIPATDISWVNKKELKYPAISDEKLTKDYEERFDLNGKKYYMIFGRFNKIFSYIHTSLDTLSNVNKDYMSKAIGVVAISTFRLAEVDPKLEEAYLIFEEAGTLYDTEDYSNAKSKFVEAKFLFDALGDKENSQKAQEMVEKCEEEIRKQYEEIQKQELRKDADSLFEQGMKAFESKNYENAKSKFEQAKQRYNELNDEEMVSECDEWLQKIESQEKKAGIGVWAVLIGFVLTIGFLKFRRGFKR